MEVLEKRTSESRLYYFDCSADLASTQTIASVTEVIADEGSLTFGTPAVNSGTVTFADGTTADAGKVIQVLISGGTLPEGQAELLCTVRARYVTSDEPLLEATVLLRLTDRVTE